MTSHMDNYIVCRPVMVPASRESESRKFLLKDKEGTLAITSDHHVWKISGWKEYKVQHLYLVSDGEIKKYEWFYASDRRSIYKNEWDNASALKEEFPFYHKIEASTDTLLGLPLIPQSFVEKYASKQGKIEKAHVLIGLNHKPIKKIDTNEVTILPIKDSWNREELKTITKEAFFLFNQANESVFNEWFDKNY